MHSAHLRVFVHCTPGLPGMVPGTAGNKPNGYNANTHTLKVPYYTAAITSISEGPADTRCFPLSSLTIFVD